MNSDDYTRYMGEQMEALRAQFPSVKNCGECNLLNAMKVAADGLSDHHHREARAKRVLTDAIAAEGRY